MNSDTVIEFRVLREVDRLQARELYREAGWWAEASGDDLGQIDRIVAGSFRFVGALDGARLVGMGRALSDGISDAYIQDVVVAKCYRGRGIGASIIRKLVEELRLAGIGWIGLIGEPGTAEFYTRLGFKPMIDYTPMLLKD